MFLLSFPAASFRGVSNKVRTHYGLSSSKKQDYNSRCSYSQHIPSVGSESHLEELPVNHRDLKGGDDHGTHAEGTLRPADLLQQLGPLSLRTVIEQHCHLGQTQGSLALTLCPHKSVIIVFNRGRVSRNMCSHLRCEPLELTDPVGKGGQGGHDQEGAHDFPFHHHSNVGDALDGLSQSHLISQNSIDTIFPQHLKTHREPPGTFTRFFFSSLKGQTGLNINLAQ